MKRLWVLPICFCLASCGGKYGAHPPYPTSGQIKVNGQPANGAMIVFHHVGDWGEKSIVPRAWADQAGRFVLSTYGVADGAPAGEYRVAVQWPAYRRGKKVGPDKLGGKFADSATSGLTVRVEEGANELPPFEIKAELVEVDLGQKRPPGSRKTKDR
jgi:hypothetical protein